MYSHVPEIREVFESLDKWIEDDRSPSDLEAQVTRALYLESCLRCSSLLEPAVALQIMSHNVSHKVFRYVEKARNGVYNDVYIICEAH